MYRLELSYDERCMIVLELFARINHLRELRKKVSDHIWQDSHYPEELEQYQALYIKVRDAEKSEVS